jgi:hypothetical protein
MNEEKNIEVEFIEHAQRREARAIVFMIGVDEQVEHTRFLDRC